jgi:hypothetical protein
MDETMTDLPFDDAGREATLRPTATHAPARLFADRVDPAYWTAATLLTGIDRGFISRAEVVRLFSDRLALGAVWVDSWQERLALMLPDEFDEVRPLLVEATAHSRERARDSDVRPWAFVVLDDLRARWPSLSDPRQDIDDVLFVLGEPQRYDVLRPWHEMWSRGGLYPTLLATLDVVIAEDAQAYGTPAVLDEANRRARASERLAFLPRKGVRLVGATRTGSWLMIGVITLIVFSLVLGAGLTVAGSAVWLNWSVLAFVAFWLSVLIRAPFVGVFVTPSDIRVASFLSTRRIPLVDVRSVGSIAYAGMWWLGTDPLVSMLTIGLRNGSTCDLPITMSSNRRAQRLARRLSALSGLSVRDREAG